MPTSCDALTEREKQTLRLLLAGHDAKSAARALNLSVHTVNERLREARRKLSVSSSREAARLLLAHEGAPQSLVPQPIGGALAPGLVAATGRRSGIRFAMGAAFMSVVALLALALYPQVASSPPDTALAAPAEVESTARAWLALLDRSDWAASYTETAASFRSLNTLAAWAAASERARVPLGAMRSRTLIGREDVPAPPAGYQVVRFRTDFANKVGAVETVSLDREGGRWRVAGVYLS